MSKGIQIEKKKNPWSDRPISYFITIIFLIDVIVFCVWRLYEIY